MTNQQAYHSRGGGWSELWNIDQTPGSEKDEFVLSEYTLVNCDPKETQRQTMREDMPALGLGVSPSWRSGCGQTQHVSGCGDCPE